MLASVGAVCRVESLAFHLEVRLNVDFGGLDIDMSKEIFDHDEGNAGLEKVHGLCMSHGMGTDSHACQSGMAGVARRRYFSRMYRAPCRPSRPPRPFCRNGFWSLS